MDTKSYSMILSMSPLMKSQKEYISYSITYEYMRKNMIHRAFKLHAMFLVLSCLTIPAYGSYLRAPEHATTSIFTAFTHIETDRLVLRKIRPEDAQDIFTILSDTRVIDNTAALELHTSIDQTKELVHQITNGYLADSQQDWMLVAIIDKTTGTLIGCCGFFGYAPLFGRAELGYFLSPHYWGKGFVTEAAQALLNFGFDTMQLNRIEATVYPENGASIRVLEKIGMHYEGLLRQHVVRNGQFRNRQIYSILRNEWQAK